MKNKEESNKQFIQSIIRLAEYMEENSESTPDEIQKVINENFWDLLVEDNLKERENE